MLPIFRRLQTALAARFAGYGSLARLLFLGSLFVVDRAAWRRIRSCPAERSYRALYDQPGPLLARRRQRQALDVVFVAPQITVDVIKDVIVLRRSEPALRVAAFVQAPGLHERLAREHLEIGIWRSLPALYELLAGTEARAVVGATRGQAELALAIRRFWPGRFVYRPYPLAHREEGGGTRVEAEKWVLRDADAIYHFFSPDAVEGLRPAVGFTTPSHAVAPACVRELFPAVERPLLSAADGRLHVAYIAGLPSRDDPLAEYLERLPEKLRSLLDAGVHVHLFGRGSSQEQLHPAFGALVDDPLCHLEPGLPYDELLDDLQRYDWGLYHFDLDLWPTRRGFEHFASNGFFTHLEAGIPMLVSPSTPSYAEAVARHGAGLVVGYDEWGTISRAVLADGRPQAAAGALAAREVLVPDEAALAEAIFGEGRRDEA